MGKNTNFCQVCGYYRQLFIWKGRYTAVHFGQCARSRHKRRVRPCRAACAKWIPQSEYYRRTFIAPQEDGAGPESGTAG